MFFKFKKKDVEEYVVTEEAEECTSAEGTEECATAEESKACCRISDIIEKLKKPFVKYDFAGVQSVYSDDESEPLTKRSANGSLKIRLLDVILALTFIVAIISIFSKNDD